MNGLYALTIIFVIFAIGDLIATKTKAIISMMFFSCVVFCIAFWNGLPETVFADAVLKPLSNVTVGMLLVHMGTTIKLKDFVREWRTVIIAFSATLAICAGVYLIGGIIIGKDLALMGAPVLAGGIVALFIMSEAFANAAPEILLFGSLVLVCQRMIGFPVASFLCKKEGLRLKRKIDEGSLVIHDPLENTAAAAKWRIFPDIPKKYNSNNMIICKLALVASFSTWLSGLTGGKVNTLVICLILGVLFREIGFLDENALVKGNAMTLIMAGVMANVLGGMAHTTPSMILSMIGPLLITLAIGIASCAVVSILVGRIFKISWYMSFAMGITALVGFPGTYVISNEVASATGETDDEKEIILQQIMPKMVIGGIVSVSITSVILAGIMAELV